MDPHLHYIFAQQRVADLQRAAESARLATEAGTRQRDSRHPSPIVRALPMPTAHPSPEAWPAARLPAGTSLTPARSSGRPAPCRTSTEHTPSTGARVMHGELLWHLHLRYLRNLQRVARELLTDVS